MKNIKAIIIDDEKDSRDLIKIYLGEHFPSVSVVGEANSIQTGFELLSHCEIDLLFLDIQLKNGLSFEILSQLDDCSFDIIFVSGHDEYAIQAIKHHAMDYLLKPVDREEFNLAMDRFLVKNAQQKPTDIQTLLAGLGNTLQKKRIKLPTLTGFKIVAVDTIVHLESDSNYTHVHLNDGNKMLVSKTLKEYESILPSTLFCRIHHSHIINIEFIEEYKKGRGGQVVLKNNTVLNVSQNKKNSLLEHWK